MNFYIILVLSRLSHKMNTYAFLFYAMAILNTMDRYVVNIFLQNFNAIRAKINIFV